MQKSIFDILPKTRTAANLLYLSASAALILSMSLLCFVPLVACLSPSCCALLPPSASYNFCGHCPRAEPCTNFRSLAYFVATTMCPLPPVALPYSLHALPAHRYHMPTVPHPSHAHAKKNPAASAGLAACGRCPVVPGARKLHAPKILRIRRHR